MVFCLLLAGSCYALWRVKAFASAQPDQPALLNTFSSGVEIVRKGLVQPELPTPETVLYEGDTLKTSTNAPPGVVAKLTLFDGSEVEIWAGSQLKLERIQTTRFSTRNQQVAIRLVQGQIRLNLASPSTRQYQDVEYNVFVQQENQSQEQAVLELGGTYRIRLLERNAPSTSLLEQLALESKTSSEYVVEKGVMTVAYANETVDLMAGQRTTVHKSRLEPPQATEWQFVRDSNFDVFSEREYNNTTIITTADILKSDTWYVYGSPSPGATPDGYFAITSGCLERTGVDPSECRVPLKTVAQFRRNEPLGHEKSFTTGITQNLQLDVTPFKQVSLEFNGRITLQSLDRAGDKGVECALGIEIDYTTQNNLLASQTYCFYARDEGIGELSNESYITSIKIPLEQWQTQKIDLLEISTLRRINSIRIYGNGHDYVSEVANVRLVAR